MNKITYQAAREVAIAIEKNFAQHHIEARNIGHTQLAPEIPAPIIQAIIDITFWASLRREEGHAPKISLAYLAPEMSGQPMLFEKRLRLTPEILTKLAPAVERPGIHLGIWADGKELYIWGTTRQIPGLCFVLEVVEPGLLVVKHRHLDGFGKFANIAVLKGEQIKIVDERSGKLPDCPALLTSLLGFPTTSAWNQSTNVLIQLAISMRAHGRGGSLLVVPTGSSDWQNSIIRPMPYGIAPAYLGISELMQQNAAEKSQAQWQATLRHAIEGVAGLTAVDGATIISDQYELLAFGAKIGRPEGMNPVNEIIVTEPVLGIQPKVIHPATNGGTRHLSAAQFVHDQRDALALVASQDGRFTIFAWSACEGMVHAHRVDTLLL
ncbi:putative sensor domain DACNV-containing protein [Adhaeribacter rhizoryzae]|uniref:Probable sensor domain-containing protein n=1 Tax=Adhaeribacter rhizoryzae TaxID=2607907 RepID=A0A5M6DQU7_9BACT|nr:hypothetical protein [Adhaeribacter rhizoryzae]KAA5547835.1 hypothetical protein F0145_07805 [Adhaeribacter rhizoryzae]